MSAALAANHSRLSTVVARYQGLLVATIVFFALFTTVDLISPKGLGYFDVSYMATGGATLALAAVGDHGRSFWDAMLWATAARAGVAAILSEDFQDGRVLGGVRFVNPFVPGNAATIDRILPP